MKRTGRPAKPDPEKRSVKVMINLTPAEKRKIDAEAARAGIPVAVFVRNAVLSKTR